MKLIRSGNEYTLANVESSEDSLKPGNYLLKFCQKRGFYLAEKPAFVLPKKMYGDTSITKRWLKSFNHVDKSLGIALNGVKGTGKSLIAKKFCIESKMPVIIINERFRGPDFIDFITSPLLRDSVIFIDEFEKVYNANSYDEQGEVQNDQRELLSVMDGSFNTKLVFLFTMNNPRMDENMVNRLSRIKYRVNFDELDPKLMEDVIDDLLKNKEHKESIHTFFDKLGMCTLDLLIPLIQEMNMFDEDAISCGKHLNIQIEPKKYKITKIKGDKKVEFYAQSIDFSGEFRLGISPKDDKEKPIFFVPNQCEISRVKGVTIVKTPSGDILECVPDYSMMSIF